jgi:hypothetical protein
LISGDSDIANYGALIPLLIRPPPPWFLSVEAAFLRFFGKATPTMFAEESLLKWSISLVLIALLLGIEGSRTDWLFS